MSRSGRVHDPTLGAGEALRRPPPHRGRLLRPLPCGWHLPHRNGTTGRAGGPLERDRHKDIGELVHLILEEGAEVEVLVVEDAVLGDQC